MRYSERDALIIALVRIQLSMGRISNFRLGGTDRRAFCCAIFGFILGSVTLKGGPAFRPKTFYPHTLSDADGNYMIVGGWVLTTRDLTSDNTSA